MQNNIDDILIKLFKVTKKQVKVKVIKKTVKKGMSKMEYLTNTEELMMKCIWNYGKEMPFLRMGEELKDKFHKEYKRTSIRTYLFRLEDKGYIKVEKRGRKAYINALIDETTYKTEKAASMLDEWFDGSAKELFSALNQKIPKEDQESLKDMLDEMDFK